MSIEMDGIQAGRPMAELSAHPRPALEERVCALEQAIVKLLAGIEEPAGDPVTAAFMAHKESANRGR